MKKHSLIFASIILSISLNSFASNVNQRELEQDVKKLEETFQCLNEQHRKFNEAIGELYENFSNKTEEIQSNKSFFKDGKPNLKGKEAILANDLFLSETFLNLRMNYISEVATCLSAQKGIDLNKIADEKLINKGFKNKKGII